MLRVEPLVSLNSSATPPRPARTDHACCVQRTRGSVPLRRCCVGCDESGRLGDGLTGVGLLNRPAKLPSSSTRRRAARSRHARSGPPLEATCLKRIACARECIEQACTANAESFINPSISPSRGLSRHTHTDVYTEVLIRSIIMAQ